MFVVKLVPGSSDVQRPHVENEQEKNAKLVEIVSFTP